MLFAKLVSSARGYIMTILKLSDELIELARSHAAEKHWSVTRQIEYWARLGKAVEDNPELPVKFIQDTLVAVEEANASQLPDYRFTS